MNRLCVASTGGGGGKTLLSLGLGRSLVRLGLPVQPFKKGPDYIDAAWLGAACKRRCSNLDPFFLAPGALRDQFAAKMALLPAQAFALVEGNRGLYDGLDSAGACSTAGVARALDCPILLCVDCAKSTRTIAAILSGLVSFEPGLKFCGVVLNNVGSTRHERSLREALEVNGPLPVLGAIPRQRANPLPERHMGLASAGPGLNPEADAILERLADLVSANCDLPAIMAAARASPITLPPIKSRPPLRPGARIGYAWDDAFWFYYPENLEALAAEGLETAPVNLVEGQDAGILDGLDGLYLGGGFPEDYARNLSASPLVSRIRQLALAGMPVYAECGGLLLLCAGLETEHGFFRMAGLFDAVAEICPRPQGLGYVEGEVIAPNPFFAPGTRLKGHEFHYSRARWPNGAPDFALKLGRGSGLANGLDGLAMNNVWAAYTHVFAPATPQWASNFAAAARAWKASRN